MPTAMRHLQIELGIEHFPLICYNGGLTILGDGTVTDDISILPSNTLTIAQHVTDLQIHMSIYTNDDWYTPLEDHWKFREERNTKVKSVLQPLPKTLNLIKDQNLGAHKIMLMGEAEKIQMAFDRLSKVLPDAVHLYRSKDTYIEISPKAISKASALTKLLDQQYGISPSQVMAFGDNYNDIDMLQTVGYGIAVGNAREQLKAVAKEVTLHHKEDGVAVSIEKWLL